MVNLAVQCRFLRGSDFEDEVEIEIKGEVKIEV